jgi:hypothetical protein
MDVVFRFILFSALTALLFSYDILYPGQGGLAPTAIVHNIQEPLTSHPLSNTWKILSGASTMLMCRLVSTRGSGKRTPSGCLSRKTFVSDIGFD